MVSEVNKSPEYPLIAPINKGVYRPFWSVMIPTYNCASYLAETLKSVLDQDPGPEEMQIEVVDDFSTKDDPEAVVKEVGQGRVSFFRQAQNVGASRNFNTCIRRAKGHWVHILHGDDLVMQDFYKVYKNLIALHPDVTLLTGSSIYIDEHGKQMSVMPIMPANEGIVSDFAQLAAIRNWIQPPSAVVPRRVYERVGGFCEQLPHAADWEMWFRAGLEGKVITLNQPYSLYRVHSNSDTSRLVLSGENIQDCIRVVDICFEKLPRPTQEKISGEKYHYSSLLASKFSQKLLQQQRYEAGLIQAWYAFKLWKTKTTIKMLLKAAFLYVMFQLGIIQSQNT